jgi:hypothetical protein
LTFLLSPGSASEVFAPSTDRGHSRNPNHPLVVFRSSPESVTPEPALGRVSSEPPATSPAVCSPSTSSRYQAATHPEVTNPRVPCPLSVSHALRALLHPVPAGLISCRSRPWGSTLQGSSHPRSRTPSRTPLPSCGYPPPGCCVIPPAFMVRQGRTNLTSGILVDAAPWETGRTSGPCSPRVSVPAAGGLDRTTGRDPHGLFPP